MDSADPARNVSQRNQQNKTRENSEDAVSPVRLLEHSPRRGAAKTQRSSKSINIHLKHDHDSTTRSSVHYTVDKGRTSPPCSRLGHGYVQPTHARRLDFQRESSGQKNIEQMPCLQKIDVRSDKTTHGSITSCAMYYRSTFRNNRYRLLRSSIRLR